MDSIPSLQLLACKVLILNPKLNSLLKFKENVFCEMVPYEKFSELGNQLCPVINIQNIDHAIDLGYVYCCLNFPRRTVFFQKTRHRCAETFDSTLNVKIQLITNSTFYITIEFIKSSSRRGELVRYVLICWHRDLNIYKLINKISSKQKTKFKKSWIPANIFDESPMQLPASIWDARVQEFK